MMHQQISKKIIIYLFILFSLATINKKDLFGNFYLIKEFNINGLNTLESSKVYNDLYIFKNTNIFSFDKKNILEKIYLNQTVEKLNIFKNYPSTLDIKIQKTKYLAITKKNNIDYFVGENGNLIKNENNTFDLPYIFGNIDVSSFLYLKEIIDNSKFEFNEIKDLYYYKSKRWDIETKKGLILKMPINLDVNKLNLIYEIIDKDNFNDVKIIDFRQNNMMIVNG